jgi:hypothetical protein
MGQNIIYKCEKCGEIFTSLSVFRIHECGSIIINDYTGSIVVEQVVEQVTKQKNKKKNGGNMQ